jgi:hypothetical protein
VHAPHASPSTVLHPRAANTTATTVPDDVAEDEEVDADEDEKREEEGDSRKKKGKRVITVRGCLHGTTLGDVAADEEVEGLTPSLALRTSREMRRKLKDVDRHQVELTGVFSPAPRNPLSGKWGGTTVTIGAADPRRSPAQQTQPAVASLEVQSVESLSPSCP